MKGKTLSDKIFNIEREILGYKFTYFNLLNVEDVKEFIKKIKNRLCLNPFETFRQDIHFTDFCDNCLICKVINEEVGCKLTKEQEQSK
jgi:hypothetical protein